MHPVHIFLGTLLVGLLAQGWLWQHIPFIDKYMWVEHMQHLATMDARMFSRIIYGHPGTPAMVMAIGAHRLFGIAWEPALMGSLAVLNALSIAGVATLAYLLKPHRWWWLVAAGMLLANRLYFSSTPPTAIVAPLLTFIILLTWWLHEKGQAASRQALLLWSVALGIAGATRADMSGLFALGIIPLLARHLGWKKVVAITLGAFFVFSLVNPFMWWMPVRHVIDLFQVMHFHYTEYGTQKIPPAALLLISPLATLAIGLATTWTVLGRRLSQPIPKNFLWWLLALTVGIGTLLLQSRFQASRYFFPLAFIWEILLPLFVLEGAQQAWPAELVGRWHRPQLTSALLVLLLVGGQLTMLLHIYWLPEVKIVCASKVQTLFCQGKQATDLW